MRIIVKTNLADPPNRGLTHRLAKSALARLVRRASPFPVRKFLTHDERLPPSTAIGSHHPGTVRRYLGRPAGVAETRKPGALQKMQEQTAQLHRQFLEGQETAHRTVHLLVEQHQRYLQAAMGVTLATTAPLPPLPSPPPLVAAPVALPPALPSPVAAGAIAPPPHRGCSAPHRGKWASGKGAIGSNR